MLKANNARKTVYLGAEDERAIACIMARHGFSTASDAVRYALRDTDRREQDAMRKRMAK